MRNLLLSLLVLLSFGAEANSAKIKQYAVALTKALMMEGGVSATKVKGKDAKAVVEYIAKVMDKNEEPIFVHYPAQALGGDEEINQYGLANLEVAYKTALEVNWQYGYDSTSETDKQVRLAIANIEKAGGQFIYSGGGAVICGGTLPNLYILDLKKMVVYLIQGSSGC